MSIIRPSQLFKITAFSFFICVGNSVPCFADQQSIPPANAIEFEGDLPYAPNPLTLKGYLRRPDGAGRHPAIVLLYGCGGRAEPLDQNWGQRLASWDYVTLTIGRTGDICGNNFPPLQDLDAYRALNFLVRQPFVDAKRVVIMGFHRVAHLRFCRLNVAQLSRCTRTSFERRSLSFQSAPGSKGSRRLPG